MRLTAGYTNSIERMLSTKASGRVPSSEASNPNPSIDSFSSISFLSLDGAA